MDKEIKRIWSAILAYSPYGLKYLKNNGSIDELNISHIPFLMPDDLPDWKLLLRPLSSITPEEKKKLEELSFTNPKGRQYFRIMSDSIIYSGHDNVCCIGIVDDTISDMIDWFNEHLIDYRGLIEKGYAIDINTVKL